MSYYDNHFKFIRRRRIQRCQKYSSTNLDYRLQSTQRKFSKQEILLLLYELFKYPIQLWLLLYVDHLELCKTIYPMRIRRNVKIGEEENKEKRKKERKEKEWSVKIEVKCWWIHSRETSSCSEYLNHGFFTYVANHILNEL